MEFVSGEKIHIKQNCIKVGDYERTIIHNGRYDIDGEDPSPEDYLFTPDNLQPNNTPAQSRCNPNQPRVICRATMACPDQLYDVECLADANGDCGSIQRCALDQTILDFEVPDEVDPERYLFTTSEGGDESPAGAVNE